MEKKKITVKAHELNLSEVLADFGGQFPSCKGKRYRYPPPEDHERWLKLVARAYTYMNRVRRAKREGKPPPKRQFKLEYAIFHCKKEQVARRCTRNLHRDILSKTQNVSGKDVHHRDPVNLSFRSAQVLSERAHADLHKENNKSKK